VLGVEGDAGERGGGVEPGEPGDEVGGGGEEGGEEEEGGHFVSFLVLEGEEEVGGSFGFGGEMLAARRRMSAWV